MGTIPIPRGDRRTNATLFHMGRLADQGVRNPLTVRLATDIVAGIPWANVEGRAGAIRGWLEQVFTFQPDPYGVETVRTVSEMLSDLSTRGTVTGDCDDAAVLAAALGKAVGMRARFVVMGFDGRWAPFAHVFAQLGGFSGPGPAWAEMDITRPAQGAAPPTRISFLEV